MTGREGGGRGTFFAARGGSGEFCSELQPGAGAERTTHNPIVVRIRIHTGPLHYSIKARGGHAGSDRGFE